MKRWLALTFLGLVVAACSSQPSTIIITATAYQEKELTKRAILRATLPASPSVTPSPIVVNTPIPTPPPTLTPTPTVTSTMTPTPSPDALVAVEEAVVLAGTSNRFEELTSLPMGYELEVLGRNEYSSWILIALPGGEQGWMRANQADFSLNLFDLPVVPTPLPPYYWITLHSRGEVPARGICARWTNENGSYADTILDSPYTIWVKLPPGRYYWTIDIGCDGIFEFTGQYEASADEYLVVEGLIED